MGYISTALHKYWHMLYAHGAPGYGIHIQVCTWVMDSGSTRFSPSMPATALNRAKLKVPVVSMISNLMSLLRLQPIK